MDKITVYTCITGGYDPLVQPFLSADGFEFICFVPKGTGRQGRDGAWEIREIEWESGDNVLMARHQKLNPHEVLPADSEWSLWIDANVRITDSSIYEICRNLQSSDVKYAGIKHPFNDCPYEEAVKCLRDRREKYGHLKTVVRMLRSHGVPEHSGLMETNLIFRKHRDPDVVEFDTRWWNYLLGYSSRDQLTHTLALLETPSMRCELLLPEGVSARNFNGLEYLHHPARKLNWLQRKLKYGLNRPQERALRRIIAKSR